MGFIYSTNFIFVLLFTAPCVCFSSWLNIFGQQGSINKVPRSANGPPSLSNFATDKTEEEPNTTSALPNTTTVMATDENKTPIVHKLLNVPVNNGTGAIFLNIDLNKMMADPYVHGIVLPAAVGIVVALLTLLLVCSIRSCIRSQVRKRRKRRIRNLAEELKADQKVLLTADSDDEI